MRACVLLSTYNGEAYLKAQIESVLSQTLTDLLLYIRDDGSTDDTVNILQTYATNRRVRICFGENLGVVKSFFELLKNAPTADLYAFCDQDDIWRPEKLHRAFGLLQRADEQPMGVCCSLAVTDADLTIRYRTCKPPRGYSLENALVQNVVTGCGLSINASARSLILERLPDLSALVMHDWWVYVVLSAMGEIDFDEEVGVLYRQHAGNAIGSTAGLDLWRRRIKRFVFAKKGGVLRRQAIEFDRCFSTYLSEERKTIVKKFLNLTSNANLFNRGRLLMNSPIYRQRKVDSAILWMLLLTNHA